MTALSRQEAKIFAINALASQVTAFRTTESESPSTTKVPNAIQNEKYLQGWLNPDNTGNVLPFAEDMNGVFLTLSYNTAYLYEKGIPEYSASQTYYENSFCQYEGKLYRCKTDNTINYVPTNTSKWDEVPTTSYSITNIGTGAKVYNESVTGPNFQLKTLVAGSNVTLTESDDSITIASTGGGGGSTITASAPLDFTNNVLSIPVATGSQSGYLSAADWTSFNGKLSSTIFSSANTWSAKNTFSADIDANAIYTTRLKTPYSSSYGSHINHYYTDSNNTETLWLVDGYDNSFANLGLFPQTNTAKLGLSGTPWGTGYINNIYTNDIYANTASTVSFHHHPVPFSNSINLGDSSHRWQSGNFYCCTIGGYGIYPEVTGNQVNLGDSLHYWDHAYVTNVHFSSNNVIAEDPNSTGLYIGWKNSSNVGRYVRFAEDSVLPVISGMTLGSSSLQWNDIFTKKLEFSTNVYLDKDPSSDTLQLYWYNTDASTYAALQLTGSCVRAYSGGAGGAIDLGNQYGTWRDLYLGVGRHIYFGGGSSINDTTGNTLDFHATSQYRFYLNNAESLYFGGGQFTPTNPTPVDLGNNDKRWNTIYYTTMNPPSDIRLKENIEPLDSGLKIVNGLDIKSFTFKNSPDHIEYGIIAQDVVDKYPELISVPNSEDGTYGTYLHNFIFASLRAIQELSAEVEILKQQLKEIQK